MTDYYLDGTAVICVEYEWIMENGRKMLWRLAGSEYLFKKCKTTEEASEILKLLKGGKRNE